MTWLARLKENISVTPGGTGGAKGAEGSLATLATAPPHCITEKKSDSERRQNIESGIDDIREAIQEHLEERAAIQEYDGGLTRKQAEAEARRALRVYEYKLTDNPDAWLVLIAPGCDLKEAIRTCHNKFGTDRILDMREYKMP